MSADGYYASFLIILTVLIFVAIVLGFMYMAYGKDEIEEEEEE